ncbi:hypothetical protein, partial [Aeromonas veronii]|uniref:hypothetical protein n=1 Tax=Aeromonas veronii TaxID=654 RepID=UPI003D205537
FFGAFLRIFDCPGILASTGTKTGEGSPFTCQPANSSKEKTAKMISAPWKSPIAHRGQAPDGQPFGNGLYHLAKILSLMTF